MEIRVTATVIFVIFVSHLVNVTEERTVKYMSCYNDNLCKFYDDCCDRFFGTPRLFTCMRLDDLSVVQSGEVFVFDRCPNGTDAELKERCERPVHPPEGLDRSVVIAGNESRLFRNAYCARCHGAHIMEPDVQLICEREVHRWTNRSETEGLSEKDIDNQTNSNCSIKVYSIFVSSLRPCLFGREMQRTCPSGWMGNLFVQDLKESNINEKFTLSQIEDNCLSKPTRYSICTDVSNKVFRNYFCRFCQTGGKCQKRRLPWKMYPTFSKKPVYMYRYSILTDFLRLPFSQLGHQSGRHLLDNPSANSSFDNASAEANSTAAPASKWGRISSALTLTCCLLSCLGLVVVVVVFAAVSSLRNFGGVLTVSLSGSLLVGLLCFLVGSNMERFPAACRLVAVVMYLAHLSSFAWMSVFALDALRTFASSSLAGGAVGGSSMCKRFAKAAVGGWLLPMIVTLAAVTVDAVWPESVVSARFGRGQCYFNSGSALLAWFFVPVAVAVVGNVAMSVAVVVVVWRTARETRTARGGSGSSKQLVVVSLKVTAIFGVTWLFGLIAALTGNEVFIDAAAIVNSLQGLFVSLSFLLSPRTIRAVLPKKKSGASASRTTAMQLDSRASVPER